MAKTIRKNKEQKLRELLLNSYKNILFPRMEETGMREEIREENARKAVEDTLKLAPKPFSAEKISKAFNHVVMRDVTALEGAILIIESIEKIGHISAAHKKSAVKIRGAGKKPSVKKNSR